MDWFKNDDESELIAQLYLDIGTIEGSNDFMKQTQRFTDLVNEGRIKDNTVQIALSAMLMAKQATIELRYAQDKIEEIMDYLTTEDVPMLELELEEETDKILELFIGDNVISLKDWKAKGKKQ